MKAVAETRIRVHLALAVAVHQCKPCVRTSMMVGVTWTNPPIDYHFGPCRSHHVEQERSRKTLAYASGKADAAVLHSKPSSPLGRHCRHQEPPLCTDAGVSMYRILFCVTARICSMCGYLCPSPTNFPLFCQLFMVAFCGDVHVWLQVERLLYHDHCATNAFWRGASASQRPPFLQWLLLRSWCGAS